MTDTISPSIFDTLNDAKNKPAKKKPAAKKAVAKKPIAKKAVVKKPTAKKAVTKKAVVKKPIAKKAVAAQVKATYKGKNLKSPQLQVVRLHEKLCAKLGGHGFRSIDFALAVHSTEDKQIRFEDYVKSSDADYQRANFFANKLVTNGYAERPERGTVKLTASGVKMLDKFNADCDKAFD